MIGYRGSFPFYAFAAHFIEFTGNNKEDNIIGPVVGVGVEIIMLFTLNFTCEEMFCP